MFGRIFNGCMMPPQRGTVELEADGVVLPVVLHVEIFVELDEHFRFEGLVDEAFVTESFSSPRIG